MHERFSEEARIMFNLANQIACNNGNDVLEDIHLLRAMLFGGSEAFNILSDVAEFVSLLRAADEGLLALNIKGCVVAGPLPQSFGVKEAIRNAIANAEHLQADSIGSENVLFGMAMVPSSRTRKVMAACKIDINSLFASICEATKKRHDRPENVISAKEAASSHMWFARAEYAAEPKMMLSDAIYTLAHASVEQIEERLDQAKCMVAILESVMSARKILEAKKEERS